MVAFVLEALGTTVAPSIPLSLHPSIPLSPSVTVVCSQTQNPPPLSFTLHLITNLRFAKDVSANDAKSSMLNWTSELCHWSRGAVRLLAPEAITGRRRRLAARDKGLRDRTGGGH